MVYFKRTYLNLYAVLMVFLGIFSADLAQSSNTTEFTKSHEFAVHKNLESAVYGQTLEKNTSVLVSVIGECDNNNYKRDDDACGEGGLVCHDKGDPGPFNCCPGSCAGDDDDPGVN